MGAKSGPRKITKETVDNYRNNKFWDSLKEKNISNNGKVTANG